VGVPKPLTFKVFVLGDEKPPLESNKNPNMDPTMDVPQLLKVLELWLTQFSRFCGKLVILTLFWSSLLSLAHLIAQALGYSGLFDGLFSITSSIYGDKIAWASTSIALATAVALGHMRNLELNEEKRREELENNWEAEFKRKYTKVPDNETEPTQPQINQNIPQPSPPIETQKLKEASRF
jgi:hypothetical protein